MQFEKCLLCSERNALELLAIVGESQKFLIFFALFAHLENSSCEQ